MPLAQHPIDALVVSALATYNYSLDRAWTLLPALRSQGLLDPSRVAGGDAGDVGNRLKAAGYDRGGITYIVAPRLITLMEAVASGVLDALPSLAAAGDRDAASALVCTVKGMGPRTALLVWELLSSGEAAGE